MMGAAFLVDIQQTHGEQVLGEFLFVCVLTGFVVTGLQSAEKEEEDVIQTVLKHAIAKSADWHRRE